MTEEHLIKNPDDIKFIGCLSNKDKKRETTLVSRLEEEVDGYPVLEDLLEDMLKACLHYTRTVADMTYESMDGRKDGVRSEKYRDIAESRGRIHDQQSLL
jgi:hypothetical protein